jgi:long-chain acyl-CoA synthetase
MALSLAMLLAEAARKYPARTAAVLGEERVTYGQLWAQAQHFASILRGKYGVRGGDTVALLMPNVLDFPRAYYAVLTLGAVVVPVHALLTPPEIEYVLRDSGAKLLIGHPMLTAGTAGADRAGIPYCHPDANVRDGGGADIVDREAGDA